MQCDIIDNHQISFSFKYDIIYIKSQNISQITQQISQYSTAYSTSSIDSFNTYILHTGDTNSDDESQDDDDIDDDEIINVHTSVSGDDINDEAAGESAFPKSSRSPIARNGESRRAFRRQKSSKLIDPKQTRNLDSVKELSELMKTDFKTDTRWTNRDSNPIYDVIASSRIDVTLKRNNITFSSLSETLTTVPPLPTSAPPPLPSAKPHELVTQQLSTEEPPAEYRL